MNEIELPDDRDWFVKKYQEVLNSVSDLSIFHWIRLGICLGLLNWIRYITTSLIVGRTMEKVLTVYQMGVIEREANFTFPDIVDNVYADTILFEGLLIFIMMYGLWYILLCKFGFPMKLFGKNPVGIV